MLRDHLLFKKLLLEPLSGAGLRPGCSACPEAESAAGRRQIPQHRRGDDGRVCWGRHPRLEAAAPARTDLKTDPAPPPSPRSTAASARPPSLRPSPAATLPRLAGSSRLQSSSSPATAQPLIAARRARSLRSSAWPRAAGGGGQGGPPRREQVGPTTTTTLLSSHPTQARRGESGPDPARARPFRDAERARRLLLLLLPSVGNG